MSFAPSRLTALLLVVGLSAAELGVLDAAIEPNARAVFAQASLSLSIRRGQKVVEVVVLGVGPQPVLEQRLNGQVWEGRLLTQGSPGAGSGQQQVSDPAAGLQRVAISGSGREYRIEVVPQPGQTLQEPVVSADGRNLILQFPGLLVAPTLQTGRLDLTTPGAVPQARYAPPLRPRAVAPPLGDMAVGSMLLQNRSFVNVSGPSVTLTLNNAPAKDALMALARLGGYGFLFVEEEDDNQKSNNDEKTNDRSAKAKNSGLPLTISFQNESYARAINGALLASGLQGRLDGRTLLVGRNAASKTFGPKMSKVIRLNQVSARAAAEYLGNLGATVNFTNTVAITSGQFDSEGTAAISNAKSQEFSQLTSAESFGASVGPLRGLVLTTDSRLQTITLVGDSQLVQVAENYLRQVDLRQRQVALSVRILDINLDNDSAIENSFAFRNGNSFIVSDRGEMIGAFGNLLPPDRGAFDVIGGAPESAKPEYAEIEPIRNPVFPARVNPGVAYDDQRFENQKNENFFNFLTAYIDSGSAKTLASPTLILSENSQEINGGSEVSLEGVDAALNTATIGRPRANEAFVTVGTQEIISFTVQAGQNGAANTCQPEFGTAGLTFGARVSKIDDNGFVSFTLSPSIAVVTNAEREVPGCGAVSTLSVRRLDSGSLRVRDGQTLILTGVIQDSDIQQVSKWPILGDIPLIGQFFRATIGGRQKRELVILVTPRIIDDRMGGVYGYGYQPSVPAARQFSGSTY